MNVHIESLWDQNYNNYYVMQEDVAANSIFMFYSIDQPTKQKLYIIPSLKVLF